MVRRKITSISLVLCFFILAVTGILSYLVNYTRMLATFHTIFGFLFILGIAVHFIHNLGALKTYAYHSKTKTPSFWLLGIMAIVSLLSAAIYFQASPFRQIMDFGARQKSRAVNVPSRAEFIELQLEAGGELGITVELLRGEHYWHPQMAIWLEDSSGHFVQSLFVSQATASGTFLGGRTKSNFKTLDTEPAAQQSSTYRRVDALPYWSHKRGIRYPDGLYAPTPEYPLPGGISGATMKGSFILKTAITPRENTLKLMLEINVAFDDNEYYSEFDFPDDEVFHNGTGQLGQPSLVYEAYIDLDHLKKYYLMELKGHGHHSGQTGMLYPDLSKLTTALKIVERIIVKVEKVEI